MAKRVHRGGWPKRKRTSFIVRLEPWAAEALSALADDYNLSRNHFVSTWLEGLAVLSYAGRKEDEATELVELFAEMARVLPKDIDGATINAGPIWKMMRKVAERKSSLKDAGGKP